MLQVVFADCGQLANQLTKTVQQNTAYPVHKRYLKYQGEENGVKRCLVFKVFLSSSVLFPIFGGGAKAGNSVISQLFWIFGVGGLPGPVEEQ